MALALMPVSALLRFSVPPFSTKLSFCALPAASMPIARPSAEEKVLSVNVAASFWESPPAWMPVMFPPA